MPQSPNRAVIFSFHTVGFGARKAGYVFVAEEMAKLGWRVDFVTTHVSRFSQLASVSRLSAVPADRRNVWIEPEDGISAFVWIPAFHPATSGVKVIDRLATPLFALYPRLLPKTLIDEVRASELVIIESSSAVLLFPYLKRLAPEACFVYAGLDPLAAVGMHPMLSGALRRTAAQYDLVVAPSHQILEDLPDDANAAYLPQGVEKELFDVAVPSPFEGPGPHAVVAGDMMFDAASFAMMVENFPDITFHAFGEMALGDAAGAANLRVHGEVPFETLRDYIVHADIGIAPYLDLPEIHYLMESSLKLVQYTYARLPIVAPRFCKGTRTHLKGYVPGDESSIIRAVAEARRVDRASIDRSGIYDWRDVTLRLLGKAGFPISGSCRS